MKFLIRVFISWLPLALAITGLCLLISLTVQQNYRQSLNDPQIQMAEDAAAYLAKDYTPAAVVPRGTMVDLRQSLAPWIAVYDASGMPLESSGVLDGAPPQMPPGVFEDTAKGLPLIVGHHLTSDIPAGENRLSWQPRPDVRQAIVIVQIPGSKGFVVAGRNMREVENREGDLSTTVLLAWLVLLAATLITKVLARLIFWKLWKSRLPHPHA